RLYAGDHAREYLVLLRGELVIDYAPLRLADALDDDLLGGLGGDTAEFLRLNRDGDDVPDLRLLREPVRGVQVQLRRRVLDLVHDGLVDDELDALLALVQYYLHVFAVFRVVLPEGGQHGLLYLLEHVPAGYALFLLYVLHRGEEFCVHSNCAPLSYRHAQPHLGDLSFLVGLFHAVYIYRDGPVCPAAEQAGMRLRALHRLIVPHFHLGDRKSTRL